MDRKKDSAEGEFGLSMVLQRPHQTSQDSLKLR